MAKDEMVGLCKKFASGELSHGVAEDIMVQLRAEGSRRGYSFVFETLFRRRVERVAKTVPGLVVSFGWHIGYDSSRAPAYWFRLLDAESDWNQCDDAFLSRLSRLGVCGRPTPVTVLRVMYSETDNALMSSEARAGGWMEWQPLADALISLPGKGAACRPRDMDGSRRDDVELVQMMRQLGMAELRSISVQRRFMNCVLGPILGADGTDLDAIALTPSGELSYIEFKRKYPSSAGVFGMDVRPHVETVTTMTTLGVGALHVLLVPPVWDSEASPLDCISDEQDRKHWAWLVSDLHADAFGPADDLLYTHGAKAGQRSGQRAQRRLKWEAFRLLHRGLTAGPDGYGRLRQLLCGERFSGEPPVSYLWLGRITVNARRRRLDGEPTVDEFPGSGTQLDAALR